MLQGIKCIVLQKGSLQILQADKVKGIKMKMKICDDGAQLLAVGIVRQAVNDYCNCVESLAFNNDTKYIRTELEENTRQQTIKEILIEMQEIEKFFKSDWYKELCVFDGDYMIKTTKEKSISDMVVLCIARLNKIKRRNRNSKKSLRALEYFRRVKLFLESDYLQRFTDKDCDY